jgi:hypothetical protein
MSRDAWAAIAATIAVLVVGILGFRVLGGPANQRLVQADLQKVRTLSELARQINMKWAAAGKTLPVNLDHFSAAAKQDPVSGTPFVYHPKSTEEYELCATFATDSRDVPKGNTADPWIHSKGDYCFPFDASQAVPFAPYNY